MTEPTENEQPPPESGIKFHGPELPGWVPTVAGLICIIVFIGVNSGAGDRTEHLSRWGWGPASSVWSGHLWLLVTSAFLHEQLWHVAFNVYWLWQLGKLVEGILGKAATAGFLVLAAAFTSLAEMLVSDGLGIGFSGVGYALFGFLWVARRHVEAVRLRLTSRLIGLFVIWLVGCWVATRMGVWSVGNAAHVSGLILGALLGAVRFELRWRRPALAGALALLGLAAAGIVYAPWSKTWTALQGQRAWERQDFDSARAWFSKSLSRGQDPAWSWQWIALADRRARRPAAMETDLAQLERISPQAADQVRAMASDAGW
jgi:GlpG protein